MARQRAKLLSRRPVSHGSKRMGMGVSREYAAALKAHLASGRKTSLRTAGELGRRAVAAGLETSDLARIHEQALIRLVSSRDSSRTHDAQIARAAPFFIEALGPFENTHRAAVVKNGHLDRLNGTMHRRTVELADAKRRLKREFVRRQSVGEALKKGEEAD